MKNFDFLRHAANITPCQAHFCTWDGLSDLCSTLLTGFFKRLVSVGAYGDERGDGWSLKLDDKPLSADELTALMNALNADDCDRDINDFGEYPIWELSHSLGQKLVARTLPFVVEATHASDDGVWFTGKASVTAAHLLIEYPETDCTPDILMVPMEGEVTKEAVITAFRHAMRFDDTNVHESLPDRLSRLDLIVADMEMALNVKISSLSIDAIDEIQG